MSNPKYHITKVGEEHRGVLLLDFVNEDVKNIPKISKSQIRKFLKEKAIFCLSRKREINKPRHKLQRGDEVHFDLSKISNDSTEKVFQVKPIDFPLEILHEEEGFAIVNKPRGILVHPSNMKKPDEKSLVNVLVHHFGLENLSSLENDPLRPGIVHRLDRLTSGCLMVMKTVKAHEILKKQLMSHETYIKREYLTLARGSLGRIHGIIDLDIGRHPTHYAKRIAISQLTKSMEGKKENTFRRAKTEYTVLEEIELDGKKFSLVRCSLFTGRTHQIRVHLSCIGHPIVGDTFYGDKWENQPLFLRKILRPKEEEKGNSRKRGKKKSRHGKRGKGEIGGQVLHATMIEFVHPDKFKEEDDFFGEMDGEIHSSDEEREGEGEREGEEEEEKPKKDEGRVRFDCQVPKYFQKILEYLRTNGNCKKLSGEQ